MDDSTRPIPHHLNFDMARSLNVALGVDATVSEVALGFTHGGEGGSAQLIRRAHDAHALAAAARSGFDQKRELKRSGRRQKSIKVRVKTDAGRQRDASFCREFTRADFIAHQLDDRRLRADKADPRVFYQRGKSGVLGEKPIAGMDTFGAGLLCRGNDSAAVQISRRGRRGRDFDGVIGIADVLRVAINVMKHSDTAQAKPAGRADYPAGDFAAIRDQDTVKHAGTKKRVGRVYRRGPATRAGPR